MARASGTLYTQSTPARRGVRVTARGAALALELLLAVTAIPGGVAVVATHSGEGLVSYEMSQVDGPFVNYLLPGLWLLCFVGIAAAGAAWLTHRRSPLAAYAAAFCGFTMAVFEVVEVTIVPFHFLQVFFFAAGAALVALSFRMERDNAAVRRAASRAVAFAGWRVAGVTFVALFALYAVVLQPWLANIGSTSAERATAYAGDELKKDPIWQTTRSITINAPASEVWAWLVQHGQDRAGFYSYDWLENLLGSDIHNGNEIRPEWQGRPAGEQIPLYRRVGDSYLGVSILDVNEARPNELLLTTSEAGDTEARVLIPIDANTTRLVFRDREGVGDANIAGAAFHYVVYEPMHFVMQRRMMVGIKLRAEGTLGEPVALHAAAVAGWVLSGAALAVAFIRTRGAWPWAVLPIVAAAPALLLARDPSAALVAALAVGTAMLGAVVWGRRWWPRVALLTAVVLLALLLAADAYLVFGLGFIVIAAGALLARALLREPQSSLSFNQAM